VDALLQSALQLAPEAQEAFLQEACCGDPALAAEVRSLLVAHGEASGILDRPAMELAAKTLDADDLAGVPAIRPKQEISHYRVLRQLGRGGMGVVYEAEDTRLGRHVALKLMLDADRGDRKALSRFHQEALGISSLNHPNICTIHEVETHDGTPVIVMELLDGETLKERLARGSIPPAAQIRWGMEIADALEAAHAKGVVHRDIKPANLFITSRGSIKVLDFGLAKLGAQAAASPEEPLTSAGVLTGTTAYMSPEQVRGDPIDGRTDLWSLGVVLYEMGTGVRPFEERNVALTLNAILNRAPASITGGRVDVPAGLGRIIDKALEKDRERRYAHASELRADLDALQRGGADARAAGGRADSRRTRRWAMAFVASALIVAAMFIGLDRWRRSIPPTAAPLTDQDVVVVADFENHTGDRVLDKALTQALAFELAESSFLKAMDATAVRQVLRFSGRPPDTRVTTDIARDLCLREGHKATLAGSIVSVGSSYLLALEATNCQSGATIAREQATAADKEHIVEALARATRSMRTKLGESLGSIPADQRAYARVTTTSLEALEAYYMGHAEWFTTIDSRAAFPFYQRAVELDPNFAIAWLNMGLKTLGSGNVEDVARGKAYLAKAHSLIDHVSDRERLLIAGQYESWLGDQNKGLELHRVLTQTYPRDATLHGNLSWKYWYLGQLDDALAEAQQEMRLGPKIVRGYVTAAGVLTETNRLDEAKRIIEMAHANGLENAAWLHSQRLEIAYGEADQPIIDKELAWLTARQREATAMLYRANHAAALGHHAQSAALYDRAAELAGQGKSDIGPWSFLNEKATSAALFGWCGGRGPSQYPFPVAVALCGDPTTAQQLVESGMRDYQNLPIARWPAGGQVGPIACLRGRILQGRGRAAEAAAVFEEMIRRKAANWGPEYPAAYVGLARARKQGGDVAGARQAYEAFLALWKDADPDIPLLVAARKEFANLR
jgi:tetratricopeptide (TPR) repeat protein